MQNHPFYTLPKVELHCHLDGSLPPATVRKLAKNSCITVPENEAELIRALSAPEDCKNLKEYLQCFTLPIACLQSAENLYTAAYDFIEDLAKENVVYAEVRFAPFLSCEGGLSAEDVVKSVLEGLAGARKTFGVESGVLLCAMRHRPVEENMPLLSLAEKYLTYGVAGVDLAGDEKSYAVEKHTLFFEKAAAMHLPYTIHAGEADGAHSVAAALRLSARRIGHAVSLRTQASLMASCLEHDICLELCPTSNLQTHAITSYANHPFEDYYKRGLKVCINTDNRTVSNTCLTNEFIQLEKAFGITAADVSILNKNALRASFATDEVKKLLLAKLLGSIQ